MLYFCKRYPENNLFTLKKGLIPIEDIERLPVRVIALFFSLFIWSNQKKVVPLRPI